MIFTSIVYDLDGTLIDSGVIVTELLNELRAERALPALNFDDYKGWLSIGGRGMIAAALGIEENECEHELTTFRHRYFERPTDPDTLFPFVRETLMQLQQEGFRLALCTNKPRALTNKVLSETNLAEFFTVVCAGNDLPTSKPHPDNLRVCLEALECRAADALVVGDSRVDQQLAESGGAYFAFFSGGYNDGVHLDAATPVLNRHPEIIDLIRKSKERAYRE